MRLGRAQLRSLRVVFKHETGMRTRRSSEREPADSLGDKSNVIGGWLPSLIFALLVVKDAQ